MTFFHYIVLAVSFSIHIDLRAHFGFQRDDIEQVIFEGYRDDNFEGIEKLFEIKDAYIEEKRKGEEKQ